ncbi:MAG: ribbon-helix-helix protein, CopG family [Actinobacteria bacterium]|nr:ribbon-helix-helix protein, CopG family [Actinomycetota bacterium]MCL5882612.1 ribbon-helix-helix protein, CopG family [Actinomycetota bacterium]
MLARKSKTLTISLPPEAAKVVDRLASKENKNKSQLFREMIAFYDEMQEEREWQELRRYGSQKAKEAGITEKDIERIIHEVRGVS